MVVGKNCLHCDYLVIFMVKRGEHGETGGGEGGT
jgi:hypothetical protein